MVQAKKGSLSLWPDMGAAWPSPTVARTLGGTGLLGLLSELVKEPRFRVPVLLGVLQPWRGFTALLSVVQPSGICRNKGLRSSGLFCGPSF